MPDASEDSPACGMCHLWLLLSPIQFIPERAQVLEDSWEIIEGELSLEGTFDEGGLVHAVDDGRGLVLAQGEPARGQEGTTKYRKTMNDEKTRNHEIHEKEN
jgi:hypothetical protein